MIDGEIHYCTECEYCLGDLVSRRFHPENLLCLCPENGINPVNGQYNSKYCRDKNLDGHCTSFLLDSRLRDSRLKDSCKNLLDEISKFLNKLLGSE